MVLNGMSGNDCVAYVGTKVKRDPFWVAGQPFDTVVYTRGLYPDQIYRSDFDFATMPAWLQAEVPEAKPDDIATARDHFAKFLAGVSAIRFNEHNDLGFLPYSDNTGWWTVIRKKSSDGTSSNAFDPNGVVCSITLPQGTPPESLKSVKLTLKSVDVLHSRRVGGAWHFENGVSAVSDNNSRDNTAKFHVVEFPAMTLNCSRECDAGPNPITVEDATDILKPVAQFEP